MKKILILTSNPKQTEKLRLDEEVREIQEGLQRSRSRDQFEIISKWAVRPDDLRRALLDHEPQIVHFSGHGVGADGLVLENNAGQAKRVAAQSLGRLFSLFKDKVECVLLNACYSEVQAKAIHKHIDCVIGMSQAIGDRAAIEFAVGFYDGLGADRSYAEAFEFGLTGIDLEGIPETGTPILKQRRPKSVKPSVSVPSVDTTSEATAVKSDDVVPSANVQPVKAGARSRIFISYKRGVEPDEKLALAVHQSLSQDHDVFIDQTMPIGTLWAERIEQELRRSDYLITFLSTHSVHSEMVLGEVETAHSLAKESGKPVVLPVRVGYREAFVYPLSAYLNPINWAFWDTDADTPSLLNELALALSGGDLSIRSDQSKADLLQTDATTSLPRPLSSAQPSAIKSTPTAPLEPAEGTMAPESKYYVERPSDKLASATVQRQGVTLTIKGPRQMGKSSLLIRTLDEAMKADKQIAYLDFQLFDQDVLKTADTFYREFCSSLSNQLGLPDRVAEHWQGSGGNVQRCTSYMQTHILKEVGGPLLLAMDEVDRMFDADYRSDFFSMLRNWHNNRALPMWRVWKQFDLALVTATEPYHLIANLNQSPFNVGEVILLADFTAEQVSDLNQRHGSPLMPAQERQLMALLNGHPYLVRRALYLLASEQLDFDTLLAQAAQERGPFGDHLRYHLFRIYDKPDLVQGLLQVIRANTCPDERIVRLMIAAGLVLRDVQRVVPRCQLYADYFREYLHG
ncbi:tir protein [Leptolyngbya sp. Heron Island J]|uniref:AAA-like domain-containing protein n=1 Tax=Leptolyngbya sp. Heron Island J TaxID=1385935 RepID=UPI0003B954A0|nr:AAA-like domain-containing protein [Leptolyngbya sp. Heron Island J]ESA34123.1 tir protein [Leptolyngbya sp. Heron Island J]